ncbi:MAG: hypothetical protein KGQ59_02315 [Bdellovibrionales bacterium]|nr:hypothetical protein [Bdellovibrionales bacterium]
MWESFLVELFLKNHSFLENNRNLYRFCDEGKSNGMKKHVWAEKLTETTHRKRFSILLVILAVGFGGCASPQGRKDLSSSDRLEKERILGDRWASGIGGLLLQREDPVLVEKMAAMAGKLGVLNPPRITLLSSLPAQQRTPIFVLPGYRWYFSSGALRSLRYENELAAALAAAQALSERMSVRSEELIAEMAEQGTTSPRVTLPKFTDSEWRSVNLRMVDLLYKAGYDPRGVPRFWQRTKSEWSGMSPDWSIILQEEAIAQISRKVPLMNPVVRSTEFGEIEKRLKKL